MVENCCGLAQFGAATITNMSENPIEMSFWTTQTENKVFSTYSESVKEIKKWNYDMILVTDKSDVYVFAN